MVAKSEQYVIETFSLTKIFPDWWGRAKVIAVDNLELRVKHNEIYGLLGPNGSGKTTTLKMLLSLLHPTRGKALILGGAGSDPKISARIGYLPEDSYLYKYLSAYETLDFYGRIFGLPSSVRKERIDALLEMVGLTGMANRPVGTYSKGMARRIGMAQALINDPELLILDEPTSGMDPIGTRQMKDLFVQLARRGKTILLCSHLLADVEDVCDRIGVLYGGTMQIEGSVRTLLQHTDEKQILTGAISDSAVERIKQIVESEQANFEITNPIDKLEQFFIRVVAKAQQQQQPTSGAISTGEIGGFLTDEATGAGILDKLVSTPVSDQTGTIETTGTKPAKTQPQPEPDDGLLEKLTQTSLDAVQTDAVHNTEPVEVRQTDIEQTKQSILDELTGTKESDTDSTESPDADRSGEDKDA